MKHKRATRGAALLGLAVALGSGAEFGGGARGPGTCQGEAGSYRRYAERGVAVGGPEEVRPVEVLGEEAGEDAVVGRGLIVEASEGGTAVEADGGPQVLCR